MQDCKMMEAEDGAAPLSSTTTAVPSSNKTSTSRTKVILFYKYAPLSSQHELMVLYRDAMYHLCTQLNICGRVLLGQSDTAEGINGSLSGTEVELLAYVLAMMGRERHERMMISTVSSSSSSSSSSSCTNSSTADNSTTCVSSDDELYRRAALMVEKHNHSDDESRRNNNTSRNNNATSSLTLMDPINEFWKASEHFAQQAGIPVFTIATMTDFKWSEDNDKTGEPLFPDATIIIVKEILSSGGVLSSIAFDQTGDGYLTPQQFHSRVRALVIAQKAVEDRSGNNHNNNHNNDNNNLTTSDALDNNNDNDDTVLIDCRNHKEYEIGHFAGGAIDPQTKTFYQFPNWVQQNGSKQLDGKTVLMYCTGGIRCEKASAYIRQTTNAKEVLHLKGGIHKYLEAYEGGVGEDECLFQGKNFSFDRRGNYTASKVLLTADDSAAAAAAAAVKQEMMPSSSSNSVVVGKCLSCHGPWDTFALDEVCSVCREPVLTCPTCRSSNTHPGEYHCADHAYLRHCYFTDLTPFNMEELQGQIQELQECWNEVSVGKEYRQRRRMLTNKVQRVQKRVEEVQAGKE